MDEQQDRVALKLVIYPLLFGLSALLLHLWRLDAKSIWIDEALTAYHSTFSFSELWSTPVTNKPPLYYALTSWFWSPGETAFALRLPAAILGAVLVAVGWLFGRALAGERGGHWLALFLLLSDINLHYSQEARHYILLMLGWMLLMLAMARMLGQLSEDAPGTPRHGDLLTWSLGALLMAHAHPVGFIYLAASLLAWLAGLLASRRTPPPFLYLPLLMTGAVVATLLPWLFHAIDNASIVFEWLRQPSPGRALIEWISLFGAKNLALLTGRSSAIVASALLFILSLGGIQHYVWRRRRGVGAWLLGLFLLPPLMLYLTGLVKPVYMLRTLSPLHLVAMTGLMLAITALPRGKTRIVAASVLALTLAASSWGWLSRYQKEAWRDLGAQLSAQLRPGDVVLLCESALYHPIHFYLGEKTPVMIDLDPRRQRLLMRESVQKPWNPILLTPDNHPRGAIWAVNRYRHCPDDMTPILRYLTGEEYSAGKTWRGHALSLTPYRPRMP